MDVPVKPEANAGADVREPARRRQPGLSRSDADIQQRLVADTHPTTRPHRSPPSHRT